MPFLGTFIKQVIEIIKMQAYKGYSARDLNDLVVCILLLLLGFRLLMLVKIYP